MIRLTSILIITISLLAATRVNAVACGDRTCLTGEQCCADSYMGPTCFNPADHSCPSTSLGAGDSNSGYRLCGLNDSACGSACYDSKNYFCCNQQIQQIGQACAQQTTAPTSAPATTSTPTTQSPPQLNCPGANNFGGVNCSDASLCCGYGTITPSCLPADGSKKCCVHFKASTQCNQDQVCGGSGGPGASSYAACGPTGTTFCDKGTGQGTFCAQDKPTCCGYTSGFGFCCPDGCACNNNYYNCSCPATTTIPATTQAPTSAPTTVPVTQAPVKNNCPGAANSAGVNCSDASLCCGYGTITPSCLPADGSKQCCTHFLASTQCNKDQVCGGGGGPGASSYAQCGAPGSTYCDKGTGQGTFCSQEKPTCCGYYSGFGFCCPAGCACNNNYYNCSCPTTTTVPTTSAPTSAPTTIPTTIAPTQAPVMKNCPGANNVGGVNCSDASLCCGYGTISPSCLPADGSKKCCTHFLAATQCNPDQVCGGSGGPGASSYASCGAPGTTFCDKGTGQGTFCTQDKPTCCGYNSGFGFCCPDGCACNNNYYNCSCPSTTTVPATTAPTSPPATSSPLPTTASTTCGGRTCSAGSLCCNDIMNGEICYDPSAYQCAATTSASSGASGSLLCPSNLDACGSACYNKSDYYCCNNQLRQNGQPCSA